MRPVHPDSPVRGPRVNVQPKHSCDVWVSRGTPQMWAWRLRASACCKQCLTANYITPQQCVTRSLPTDTCATFSDFWRGQTGVLKVRVMSLSQLSQVQERLSMVTSCSRTLDHTVLMKHSSPNVMVFGSAPSLMACKYLYACLFLLTDLLRRSFILLSTHILVKIRSAVTDRPFVYAALEALTLRAINNRC